MTQKINKRKRKLNKNKNGKEAVMPYEKVPRFSQMRGESQLKKLNSGKDNVKKRQLLPIKAASGVIISQEVEEEIIDEKQNEETTEQETVPVKKTYIPESKEQMLINRKKVLTERRTRIGFLATSILAEPQASLKLIKELRLLVEDRESPECLATVRKWATASMSAVFIDIIPGYKIRKRTEKEKAVKLSKEVKQLTDYEDSLLNHYQIYLQCIEKMIDHRHNPGKAKLLSAESEKSIGEIAIRSLCELYTSTTHFNFHLNLTVLLVKVAYFDSDPELRKLCCDAIKSVFRSDKLGSATLETVRAISKITKEKSIRKIKPELLDTLLNLRINHVDFSMAPHAKTKLEKKKDKDEKKRLSRKERKQKKKMAELENELKEAAASEDLQEKTKFQTETIQQVFWIYFRVLKQKKEDMLRYKDVLPSVLEGLALYAHLINITFFSDLLNVLQKLTSTHSLTLQENLHCVYTAFQILSGQGEMLNIDPVEYYKLMYKLIFDITTQSKPEDSEKNLDILTQCLDIMLKKRRKQVTLTCLCAFIKRIAISSMNLTSPKLADVMLNQVQEFLNVNSKTQLLFDIESEEGGVCNMEEDDPQFSNSQSTVMWEMHSLRRHFSPNVQKSANQLVRQAAKSFPG